MQRLIVSESMERCGLYFCLLMALVIRAGAAEYAPHSEPDVSVEQRDNGMHVVCDWGVVSNTLDRTPQDCERDLEELRAYVRSPEFQAWFREQIAQGERVAGEATAQLVKEHEQEYQSAPQEAGLPTRERVDTREVAPSLWQARIPWEVRKTLVLAVIDFRDVRQVEWAVGLARTATLTGLFAVGWNSHAEVDGVIRQFPELANLVRIRDLSAQDPRASVAVWAAGWGIDAVPAQISFPDPTIVRIREGLEP